MVQLVAALVLIAIGGVCGVGWSYKLLDRIASKPLEADRILEIPIINKTFQIALKPKN